MKKIKIVLLALLVTSIAQAQTKKTAETAQSIAGVSVEQIKKIAQNDANRLSDIFKDLHQHPELAFKEVRTAAIVAKELKALGYTVMTEVGVTGVVGILKNGDGPIIMYRADMDCNSVKETTGLPYASTSTAKNDAGLEVPVMHACGHDLHVTWMLGIAKAMVNLKNNWKGTLVMIGQPSEEPGGGADAMAAEMYTKKGVPVPTYLLGMHTAPVGVGLYLNMHGDRMAGADQLDVTFNGVGGHGSAPQETKDPVVMAANAILQYQTLISRNMDPQRPAVVTVGAVSAGIDNNVIPASATLRLNLRWFNDKDRSLMIEGIKKINEGIAVANNLPKELYPTINMKQYVIPLKNDKALVEKINPALEKIAGGPEKNLQLPPVMGSEDFQHLVKNHPIVAYDYLLVGIASPKKFEEANKQGRFFPFFNHNGDFEVDLSAIPYGMSLGLAAVLEAFKK